MPQSSIKMAQIALAMAFMALATLTSAHVFGQEEALDAGDDNATADEEDAEYDDSFGDLDTNSDGFITSEEYNAWSEQRDDAPTFGAEEFGAGTIDEDEWFGEDTFADLDSDESGTLDEQEWIVGPLRQGIFGPNPCDKIKLSHCP